LTRARGEHGFTMIEMLVVCLILGVVLAGITVVFVSGSHSELNLNNRVQAQQAAQLALNVLRTDAQGACAANVPSGTTLVLGHPLTVVSPAVPDLTTCGAANTASYLKFVWCVLASPTVTGQYALYRATPTGSNTCTVAAGAKLEADNLTSNAVFSLPLAGSQIQVEQLQTFTVAITVSRRTATNKAGQPFTLAEALTLRNGVYETGSSSIACSVTDSTICTQGRCPFTGLATTKICYAAAIQ
jgi:prepilin-type N-terminal cleavage/methylation domain-containing protein